MDFVYQIGTRVFRLSLVALNIFLPSIPIVMFMISYVLIKNINVRDEIAMKGVETKLSKNISELIPPAPYNNFFSSGVRLEDRLMFVTPNTNKPMGIKNGKCGSKSSSHAINQ